MPRAYVRGFTRIGVTFKSVELSDASYELRLTDLTGRLTVLFIMIARPSRVIWEDSVALAQLRNKVLICYNGTPHIYPKTALYPPTITTPSNTPIPRPTPLDHHPKRHPDLISRFVAVHFPNSHIHLTS